MPKFPDRWFDYSDIGNVIDGTKIITFKVPLKESFFANKQNSEDFRFSPATLIDRLEERGQKLGLVIDLTFTKRYYDEQEFTDKGVEYKKIFVEGHVIPSQEVIDKFYEAVDNFIETSEEGTLIGVHCTHGVNRTGYVVCRYMVEHLGMKATDSLEAYRIGRGYPVERINYINDLKRRAREPVSKEDEEREKREEKERKEKSHKSSGKQENYHKHESRSDRSNWRTENHSYQNSRIPPQNHYHQNDPRWDRNNGYYGNERLNERPNENYGYPYDARFDGYGGYYDSERLNENSYEDQYGSQSANWRNRDRQYYDETVVADYDLDPNTWYGYHRPSQPHHGHGYTNGPYYNNSRHPGTPYLENFNQHWGSGANQEMPYDSGAQGYRDSNWENNSYDRSYTRQNSSSMKQGRTKKGSDRMKPF